MTTHVRHVRSGATTALLLAVHGGRTEEVERLLAGGVGVNIADEDGITPLMASAMNGHLAVARLLLAAGAYRCMFNKWGMTAHDIAVWHGYEALATLLEEVSDRNTGGRVMKKVTRTAGLVALAFGTLALVAAGCKAVGPDYQTPSLPVPPAWRGDGAPRVATTNDAVALERWWEVFSDTNLSALVACARLNNLDVAQAEARLRKARAQRKLAKAERLPTVDANGSASRSRGSEKTGSGQTSTLYANAFDATWEADLFGAKRRAVESAEASLQASREDLRDVRVSLFAEVALNYVGYRSYQVRLAITETNLASQTETYAIACWRQQANLVTQLDVDQARLSLEQTRAEIPSLRTGRDQAEHQLATLLGQAPGSLAARLGDGQAIPVAADTIAVGVPADVVRRRPDVRKAERALAAQTAQIGVAQAARYPDLTLSGSIGLEALRAGDLYTAAARSASGAVRAGWTLFDGGQLRQKVAIETAYQEELLGAYEQSVLTALQDVENALAAYANEQDRRRALADAVVAGLSAFRLARDKYESGLIDFETVLSTQQSLLSVQNSLAASEADVTSDLIRLYKALGGGWNPLEPDRDAAKD